MGFFKQAVKFAGFAGEKAATTAASHVPGEAAAFLKGLDSTNEFRFVHSQEQGFQQISLMQGEKKFGNIKFKEFGEGITVTGIYSDIKGAGTKLRMEAGRIAKQQGKQFVISDVFGSMSQDEMASWDRLKKMGYTVEETNVPYSELGLNREGSKFAYKWNIAQEEIAAQAIPSHVESTVKHTTTFARDSQASMGAMKMGTGHDNSSLLNRSMSSNRGSRKTSGAL